MQITDYIQQLLWVEVYADSDKYRNPADARGPENVETVEILLAGEVLSPAQDGTLQRFGRGTIFWHQSCEYSICRNAVEDSRYRCAVFAFASTAKKTTGPQYRSMAGFDTTGSICPRSSTTFFSRQYQFGYVVGVDLWNFTAAIYC